MADNTIPLTTDEELDLVDYDLEHEISLGPATIAEDLVHDEEEEEAKVINFDPIIITKF